MSGVPGDGEWLARKLDATMEEMEELHSRLDRALDEGYRDGWADAVEACARVVEERAGLYTQQLCGQFAAAIRALKSEPKIETEA